MPEETPSADPEATPTAMPEETPSADPEATPTAAPEETPGTVPEPTPGTVTVTKYLILHGEEIAAESDVFYVSLFFDDGFTQMAVGPVAVEFNNSHVAVLQFGDLGTEQIYYLCETDAYGNPIETGTTSDGTGYTPYYPAGQMIYVDAQGNASFTFSNEFQHLPEHYYWPSDPDRTPSPAPEETPSPTPEATATPGAVPTATPSSYLGGGGSTGEGSTEAGGSTSAAPVTTGDDTPVGWLFALMAVSAAVCAFLADRRRNGRKSG